MHVATENADEMYSHRRKFSNDLKAAKFSAANAKQISYNVESPGIQNTAYPVTCTIVTEQSACSDAFCQGLNCFADAMSCTIHSLTFYKESSPQESTSRGSLVTAHCPPPTSHCPQARVPTTLGRIEACPQAHLVIKRSNPEECGN
jgi:hypothetical protein